MKVDYLAIKFTTFMISSRTKHEPFDSFGSHALFFFILLLLFPYPFLLSNEPILYFLFSVYISIYRNPYKTR